MNKQTQEALKMAHKTFMQLNERSPRKDDGSGYFDKEINACKQALEQPSNMVAVPLDKLEDMQRRLSDCEEYLKENETPAECIARNRKDVSSSLKLLAKCMGEKKALATNKESSLVQPAQEPYAWATEWEDGEWSISHSPNMGKQSIPLYPHSTPDSTLDSTLDSTHPHQWQELTNEDIARLILINEVDGTGDVGLARLVEHASRIKNHG